MLRSTAPSSRLALKPPPLLPVINQITKAGSMTGRNGVRVRRDCSEPGKLNIAGFCRFLKSAYPQATAFHVAHLTGISASTVTKWLIGENRPSGEHLAVLTAALGPAFLRACLTRTPSWLDRACEAERLGEIEAEMARLAGERAKLVHSAA